VHQTRSAPLKYAGCAACRRHRWLFNHRQLDTEEDLL
jgi:hypothetical protein